MDRRPASWGAGRGRGARAATCRRACGRASDGRRCAGRWPSAPRPTAPPRPDRAAIRRNVNPTANAMRYAAHPSHASTPHDVEEDPQQPGERRDADEPLAADEELRRDVARDVDEPASCGRSDHGECERAEHRKAGLDPDLGSDDRVPGQRERGHELEGALAEELASPVRQAVADDAGHEAQGQVGRIGQGGRHLVHQHVSSDAAADAAQDRHEEDPDDRPVLVVIGSAAQQGAVQGVGGRGQEVDRRHAAGELPRTPVDDRREEVDLSGHVDSPGRSTGARGEPSPPRNHDGPRLRLNVRRSRWTWHHPVRVTPHQLGQAGHSSAGRTARRA